jgi:pilus assembly protein CpaB
MRIGIVILVLLGIVAAGAATFLVQAVTFKTKGEKEVPKVSVLVADANLPARTRLTESHVKVEKAPKAGLPAGYFIGPAQVVGKVLRVPIVRGQPLTESLFLAKGSLDDLLRPGMRAYQISLSNRSTPVDMLYPGCIVDVFATFTLRGRDSMADAVVVPLLQKVQVLGVHGDTVMTSQQPDAKSTSRRAASSSTPTVTLEVSAAQVSALQLALQGGTLGIALRNANDDGFESMEPMSRKGAKMSVDPETLALLRRIHQTLGTESAIDPDSLRADDPVAEQPKPVAASPAPVAEPAPVEAEARPSGRSVTVIRAQKQEEVQVKGDEPNEPAESIHAAGAGNR